MMKAFVR